MVDSIKGPIKQPSKSIAFWDLHKQLLEIKVINVLAFKYNFTFIKKFKDPKFIDKQCIKKYSLI